MKVMLGHTMNYQVIACYQFSKGNKLLHTVKGFTDYIHLGISLMEDELVCEGMVNIFTYARQAQIFYWSLFQFHVDL